MLIVSAMLEEEEKRMFDNLYRRNIIRKDSQPNKTRKYLSEYEDGLLEDYYRVKNMKSEIDRMVLVIA